MNRGARALSPMASRSLGDEDGQGGVGHERLGPEPLVELLLGKGFRALLEKGQEELKRLGREMARRPRPEKLPGAGVHEAIPELPPHRD